MVITSFTGYYMIKLYNKELYSLNPKIQMIRILRGLWGTFYIFSNLAIVKMPMQKSIVLINTSSIFIVILGALILNEKPSLTIIMLVCLSSFGIILLIDPALIGWKPESQDSVQIDCKKTNNKV